MPQLLANWWSMTTAYVTAPASLFGAFQPSDLVPLLGLVLLALGVVLAVTWREKQALWLLAPATAAALTPIALLVAHGILGWLGLGFALILGAFAVLLWIAVIASDATRRLPVWLIGLFLLSYIGYCGFLFVLLIWSA